MLEDQQHEAVRRFPKAACDVVAMVASAGGLTALSRALNGLPAEFPAAIVVVQHLDRHHRSLMVEILSKRASLRVKQAAEDAVLMMEELPS